MVMDKNSVRDTVNELLEICYDSQRGYDTAADAIDNPEYAELLRRHSRQRATYVTQLRRLLNRYGGGADDDGHFLAVFHRAWLNIVAIAAENDSAAIMAECARGEEIALATYVEAFEQDLPDDIRNVVRRQLVGVRDAHDQIRALAAALAS